MRPPPVAFAAMEATRGRSRASSALAALGSALLPLVLIAASPGPGPAPILAEAGPAGVPANPRPSGPEGFRGSVEKLSPELRRRMTGVSWHEGCPVGLGELRLVRATHLDFDGNSTQGALVVHERYARGMIDVLRRLWAKRFPIRRMELIDRYGGDDHRSMAHDNTSAFNCRFVAGTTRWSMHAYGKAVDINPRENPYVSGDLVSPPEGRRFADRSRRRPGMIFRDGPVRRSFERIVGWEWGGLWPGPIDYQHLSADGT